MSLILRPSIPPLAFCRAMRALAAGTMPGSSAADGPVSDVMRPMVIELAVPPGADAEALALPTASTDDVKPPNNIAAKAETIALRGTNDPPTPSGTGPACISHNFSMVYGNGQGCRPQSECPQSECPASVWR